MLSASSSLFSISSPMFVRVGCVGVPTRAERGAEGAHLIDRGPPHLYLRARCRSVIDMLSSISVASLSNSFRSLDIFGSAMTSPLVVG